MLHYLQVFLPLDPTVCLYSLLTWHGGKKLDSVSMSMETQLGVGHGAVRHEAARHGTV